MFDRFKLNFKEFSGIENPVVPQKNVPFKFTELLLECGGKPYESGLYTIHSFQNSVKWTQHLYRYFEKYKGGIISFAHDWMGRQYCVSLGASECIYMFDPATQEDFYFEENLFDFHNVTLSNTKVENLASEFFQRTLEYLQVDNVDHFSCLGFKTPLFLNGKDELNNYKLIDLEVYWDIEYQLYQQVSKLPPGTHISEINISI